MPASVTSRLRLCAAIRNAAFYGQNLSRIEELARVAAQLEAELLAQSPEQLRRRVKEEAAAALKRKQSLRGTIGELLAELTTEVTPQGCTEQWWLYLLGSLGWGYLAWRYYPFAACFGLPWNELPGFAVVVVLGALAAATLPVLLAGLLAEYLVYRILGRDAPAADVIWEGLINLLRLIYFTPIVVLLLGVVGCGVSLIRGI